MSASRETQVMKSVASCNHTTAFGHQIQCRVTDKQLKAAAKLNRLYGLNSKNIEQALNSGVYGNDPHDKYNSVRIKRLQKKAAARKKSQ